MTALLFAVIVTVGATHRGLLYKGGGETIRAMDNRTQLVDSANRVADRTRRVLIERVRSIWTIYRRPTGLAAIGVSATLVLALIVVFILWQTGGADAVSKNAALIGALIALGGVFTTQLVNTGLEAQRAREAALQKYFEQAGKLLIEHSLRNATPGGHLSTVARAQTLAVLEGLDPERKRLLVQFLYESNLIKVDKPLVSLKRANLREADLREADLKKANLERARLRRANLREADLEQANLKRARLRRANLFKAELEKADLREARLREVNLREADLEKADLREARLKGADLREADLREADLREAKNLTQEQINAAHGDETTKLPDNLQRPAHWSKGDERQPSSNMRPV